MAVITQPVILVTTTPINCKLYRASSCLHPDSLLPEGLDYISICEHNLLCASLAGETRHRTPLSNVFTGLCIHDFSLVFAINYTNHLSFPCFRA